MSRLLVLKTIVAVAFSFVSLYQDKVIVDNLFQEGRGT